VTPSHRPTSGANAGGKDTLPAPITRQTAADPAGRFLRKYGLPADRGTAADVRRGLESGYPDCCVLFFVTAWSVLGERARDRYRGLIGRLAPAGPG
jgi:hypothetical protein